MTANDRSRGDPQSRQNGGMSSSNPIQRRRRQARPPAMAKTDPGPPTTSRSPPGDLSTAQGARGIDRCRDLDHKHISHALRGGAGLGGAGYESWLPVPPALHAPAAPQPSPRPAAPRISAQDHAVVDFLRIPTARRLYEPWELTSAQLASPLHSLSTPLRSGACRHPSPPTRLRRPRCLTSRWETPRCVGYCALFISPTIGSAPPQCPSSRSGGC
jgi:hypothetical protein